MIRPACGLNLIVLVVIAASPAQASKPEIRRLVVAEAARNGVVPTSLALAVARVESNFDPGAVSSAGARGVMQIMPRTANSEFGVSGEALWDPRINVRLGLRYLAQLYDRYGRRWDLALSHYNGGSLARSRSGRPRAHFYTRRYVERVLAFERQYRDVLPRLIGLAGESGVAAPGIPRAAVRREHALGWKEYLSAADYWLGTRDAEKQLTAAAAGAPRQVRPSTPAPPGYRSLALKRRFTTTAERFRAGLEDGS